MVYRPPESEGHHAVRRILKLLLTIFLVLLGYELLVYALHLLNQPSDRAVYEGTAGLLLLLFFLPFSLWRLWRRIS